MKGFVYISFFLIRLTQRQINTEKKDPLRLMDRYPLGLYGFLRITMNSPERKQKANEWNRFHSRKKKKKKCDRIHLTLRVVRMAI